MHYQNVAAILGIMPGDVSGSENGIPPPAKKLRIHQSQSNDSMSLNLRLDDDDELPTPNEGLPTSFQGVLSQTPSSSKQSSAAVVKSSRPKPTTVSNVSQIADRLNEQQVNNELHKKYLVNQLERSELTKEKERMLK